MSGSCSVRSSVLVLEIRSEDAAAPVWKDMQQRLGRTASSVATTVPGKGDRTLSAKEKHMCKVPCQDRHPTMQPRL